MKRRTFMLMAGLGLLGAGTYRHFLDQGLFNPCRPGPLPKSLRQHPLYTQIWQDIVPEQCWDVHTHLVGMGDGGSGIWVNPNMQTWRHPLQRVQMAFYLNAACIPPDTQADQAYVQQLQNLHQDFPQGVKHLLMAFDHHYSAQGQKNLALSSFYVPNEYAAAIAARYAEFEWIASIHPYRADALEALHRAIEQGAKAVKWLPPAMGIDPSAPQCDAFYALMAKHHLPLITHGGDEKAVHSEDFQRLGNPLRLRRPLDHGVTVVVAHCATLGSGQDLDQPNAAHVANFALFARLMDEPQYQGKLFGELSAVTQRNRIEPGLKTLLSRTDWHPRLVNGSDYPLPGVMPLFSPSLLVRQGFLTPEHADFLSHLRQYNALLFDFALKRLLSYQGHTFDPMVFATQRLFQA